MTIWSDPGERSKFGTESNSNQTETERTCPRINFPTGPTVVTVTSPAMFSPKLLLVLATLLVGNVVHALWPLPRSITTGSTGLVLSPAFQIEVEGPYPNDLRFAVARTLSYIQNDNLERLVVGRGSVDVAVIESAKQLPSLIVSSKDSKTIATEARAPLGNRDEAYTLDIPSDGSSATLSANSTLGLFRGLTTFSQLWYTHGSDIYTIEAPISISDSPAFVRFLLIPSSTTVDVVPALALPRFHVGHGSQLLPRRRHQAPARRHELGQGAFESSPLLSLILIQIATAKCLPLAHRRQS